MLIPFFKKPNFKVGDIVVSIKEIKGDYYIFTPYHEFTIIEMTNHGNICEYIIMDVDSNIKHSFYSLDKNDKNDKEFILVLKTDIETAKKRHRYVEDEKYFFEYIYNKCPHVSNASFICYTCNKDLDYFNQPECHPEYSCLRFIDESCYINDKRIIKHLRSVKINELNDGKAE